MAKGGYIGKVLRVDLTSRRASEERLEEGLVGKFGGQLGIGARMLYGEVPPGVKATDPENRLIFMTGPFTGAGVQAPSNFQVITKNAVTGCNIAVANSHGFWGARLKFAGYDGIVIQGSADKPVYLWVHPGGCEIRDASHIWGKADTFQTEDIIKEEVGQPKASVLAIGPAGENLCAGACTQNDKGHIAAKGNVGMVMGSKRLKAIAVHGAGRVPVADPARFSELGKSWREASFKTVVGGGVNQSGTGGGVVGIHYLGDLPVKNFTTGVFPGVEKLDGSRLRKTFKLERNPCYGCSLAHCHTVTVTEGPYTGFVGEEPEYESLSNLGSNLGISDAGTVMWLTDQVDRMGFDGNWAGAMVSWAMEAYERGILNKNMLGGLELRWGDEKAAAELLRKIARREGIGDLLALGLKEGPRRVGGEKAASFAVHIKGETNHAHDSRAVWGQFLGLCVAGAGPRWETLGMDLLPDPELGYAQAVDRFSPEGHARAIRVSQTRRLFEDSLGVCSFGFVSLDLETQAYHALTGQPITVQEALTMGERIVNLERAFNLRHGFKPQFDLDVSPRLLEPPPDGGAAGKTIAPHLERMVREYNAVMDWDWESGKPSKAKLAALGLDDIAADLHR